MHINDSIAGIRFFGASSPLNNTSFAEAPSWLAPYKTHGPMAIFAH